MKTYAPYLMVFVMFISSFGQILLKKSAMKTHKNKWREYFNPLLLRFLSLDK